MIGILQLLAIPVAKTILRGCGDYAAKPADAAGPKAECDRPSPDAFPMHETIH